MINKKFTKTAIINSICIGKFHFNSNEIITLIGSINYTFINLASGQKLVTANTLKKFEAQLSKLGFIRVSKYLIVNPGFISNYKHPELELSNVQIVTVSRRRRLE